MDVEERVETVSRWVREECDDENRIPDDLLGLLLRPGVAVERIEYGDLEQGDLFLLASPPTDVVSRRFPCVFRRTKTGSVYALSGPNDCDGASCHVRSGTKVLRFLAEGAL